MLLLTDSCKTDKMKITPKRQGHYVHGEGIISKIRHKITNRSKMVQYAIMYCPTVFEFHLIRVRGLIATLGSEIQQ